MMNYIGVQTLIRREIERFVRVWIQTLVSPWITALLYILIFGVVVGQRINLMAGVTYIDFVLPGIVMLNLINASFAQTSFSVYFERFARHIEEVLVAPLSNMEIILSYIVGGVVRGLVVGIGVYGIAIFFSAATLMHFFLFLFYSISVAMIFSLLGILIGLWSDNFEDLALLNTFVITPLTFLGGVFNSITMLPEKAQTIIRWNPFFYFVDGLRYSMIGVREANVAIGMTLILTLIVGLGGLVWYLFQKGWKIRT
ncbi:MAG TPA: ABC transporter permease [Candidatus Kapabacteria bacterium]|nr:ABC transporter permease [Candidatus Kapabacteria bacterium]